MADRAHTPGPWGCTTRRGSWDWLVFSEADPNIEICQPFHDGTEFNETGEANSRLIAAAPAMLEALESLEKAHELHANCEECGGEDIPELCPECFPHFDDARIKRRIAIAKATGDETTPLLSQERSDPSVK